MHKVLINEQGEHCIVIKKSKCNVYYIIVTLDGHLYYEAIKDVEKHYKDSYMTTEEFIYNVDITSKHVIYETLKAIMVLRDKYRKVIISKKRNILIIT